MRIIRNFDNHDDDHDAHDHDHGGGEPTQDPARLAEILADETEAWLAAQAAENPYTPGQTPAPTEPPRDKPVLRLIKQATGNTEPPVPVEDEHLIPALRPTPPAPAPEPARSPVPAWVRGAVPGSAVVVIAALALSEGQPATVAAPIGFYATGWVAYLAWNAGHRPPIGQVATTTYAAIVRLIAAISGGAARTVRAAGTRIVDARHRSETARTATN
ncbi:hypothetical protein [Nocardia cyriacigeorgica]|uniref:hypothetical protein n=1 Tax=Nocardia cyriacigeorgica TaxID=135487 RepID=UPI002456985E|nr:hypothetical protein [Nocardia cyriacigeorgica]